MDTNTSLSQSEHFVANNLRQIRRWLELSGMIRNSSVGAPRFTPGAPTSNGTKGIIFERRVILRVILFRFEMLVAFEAYALSRFSVSQASGA